MTTTKKNISVAAGAAPLTAGHTHSLSARLRAACNGHPHARIPWPHRLLHEAADTTDDLRDSLDEILNYRGGANSALDDEYVMERAYATLSRAKGE